MKRKAQGMTAEQAKELELFFKMERHKVTPTPDQGTCVLGNGIAVVVEVGRGLQERCVFSNPWTQCEQDHAINEMIEAAKLKYPELAGFIFYKYGNMD